MNDIALQWPSLDWRVKKAPSLTLAVARQKSNLKFWQYQWKKHGSCSKVEDHLSYFLKALELKEKLKDLKGILNKSGIKPGKTRFTPKKLIEIIEKNYKVIVNLRCNFSFAEKTVPQLIEISFCFSPKFELSSCKPKAADKCGCGGEEKEILLPDEESLPDEYIEREQTKDEL
ncbi:hypothetical protein LguiB_008933 [Lonicera macranthoides]